MDLKGESKGCGVYCNIVQDRNLFEETWSNQVTSHRSVVLRDQCQTQGLPNTKCSPFCHGVWQDEGVDNGDDNDNGEDEVKKEKVKEKERKKEFGEDEEDVCFNVYSDLQ